MNIENETWNAKVTEGTEAYKQVPNLGKYEVSNFTVSGDSGRGSSGAGFR